MRIGSGGLARGGSGLFIIFLVVGGRCAGIGGGSTPRTKHRHGKTLIKTFRSFNKLEDN
jgi:hypothetical protein